MGCIRHRGFIPHDHDIDIKYVKQVPELLKLQDELDNHNLKLLSTYINYIDVNSEIEKHIEDIQKPDYCKNLEFGKYREKAYGYFFKIVDKKYMNTNLENITDTSWQIDIFPYSKQYDTNIGQLHTFQQV